MIYDYLILDGQNFYWRIVLNTFKKVGDGNLEDLKKIENLGGKIIENALSKLESLKNQFCTENSDIYILFDNPSSKYDMRKQIYQEYKHARDKKNIPASFYKILEVFQSILIYYSDNLYLVEKSGYEADDLTLPLLNYLNFNNENKKFILISADLDWARNIRKNVHWFNYKDVLDINTFKEIYGFDGGGKVQFFKTLHGDNSDNIPNALPHCPKEILNYIVSTYNNLESLLQNLWKDKIIPLNWKVKIKDAETQLKINNQLTEFLMVEGNIEEDIIKCSFNKQGLKKMYELLGLNLDLKAYNKDEDNFFEPLKII